MPTYDYECNACGHAFELFQSIKAAAVKKCPKCGKLKVRRLIGIGAGIIFKGSGFYCTDYRDPTYAKAAEKDKASGNGAASSTESSTSKDTKASSSSDAKAPASAKKEKASKA